MAIFEKGEHYVHRITLRDRTGVKTSASTVTDEIIDPCGNILLYDASMTLESVGEYYYNFQLSSNATYGKYRTIVVAVNATGKIAKFESEFYIMPWKIDKDIRQITGISETKSISDDDICDIAWNSYKYALRDVFTHHYKDSPNSVNGSTTVYQTSFYPIADIFGDGSVTGWSTSCASDITGYWIDSNYHYNKARVNVTEAKNGEITLYQSDGVSAIPTSNNGVYLDYWSEYDNFDLEIFRRAVAYLSAHEVVNRFNELDRTTLADLNSNRPVIISSPKRFYYEYKRYIRMIRNPRCGVA